MRLATFLTVAFLATATAAELPVRQVILYKHGVGFFERAGELKPGEDARLDFKPSEMDDVLKSLTIQTPGGGRITGVRYDSSEPLAQRLQSFPFRLGEAQPLSAFLDTLKGARVEVRVGPETITGAIVGGRQTAATGQQPEKELLTLLMDSGDLRTLDLSSATNLRLHDPGLQGQLKDYLSAVSGARSRDKRSVYVESAKSGQRQMIASYVIPTPVWKSSYRLIFGEGGAATLEGWAIVDNVTGEDWADVRLSVVSGRPISFLSRLYEPRYLPRPKGQLPEERAQAPVVHAGVIGGVTAEPLVEKAFVDNRRQRMMVAELEAPAAPAPAFARADAASSVVSTAEGRELGELFEYNFATPVTVRKGESAMLPFLQQKVAARRLLIYADPRSQYPLNAAEITNDTGKALDGGPVTVFDGASYTGEALMETLKATDKRVISYAVDLGTRITTEFGSNSNMIREIHFRRGVLTTRQAAQETRTYTIRNVDQKPKTLVLEQAVRPGYELVNRKPSETTATAYRFEIKLAPGAVEKFPVVEERLIDNSYAISSMTPDVLASYVQNKALSEAGRLQLQKILQQKRLVADADGTATRTAQEINDLTSDQSRLRQNIESLNRVAGQQEQVQQYARQLAAQETQLAGLRDRLAELRKKKAALESELNSLIEKMEF
jgi:hypothetical protein